MVTAEADLLSYVIRVSLTLALMVLCAVVFFRFSKGRGWIKQNTAYVKIMASLPLGRDVFFVLRCGPDVIAVVSGSTGVRLMGRWKYEEWAQWDEEENRSGK